MCKGHMCFSGCRQQGTPWAMAGRHISMICWPGGRWPGGRGSVQGSRKDGAGGGGQQVGLLT